MGSLNKKENFKKIAKEVIDLEIKALQKLKKSLNKNFNRAVSAIVNCQSKVILCGVGKMSVPEYQQLFRQLNTFFFSFSQ